MGTEKAAAIDRLGMILFAANFPCTPSQMQHMIQTTKRRNQTGSLMSAEDIWSLYCKVNPDATNDKMYLKTSLLAASDSRCSLPSELGDSEIPSPTYSFASTVQNGSAMKPSSSLLKFGGAFLSPPSPDPLSPAAASESKHDSAKVVAGVNPEQLAKKPPRPNLLSFVPTTGVQREALKETIQSDGGLKGPTGLLDFQFKGLNKANVQNKSAVGFKLTNTDAKSSRPSSATIAHPQKKGFNFLQSSCRHLETDIERKKKDAIEAEKAAQAKGRPRPASRKKKRVRRFLTITLRRRRKRWPLIERRTAYKTAEDKRV
jgi:hypothetical protein